MYCGFETLAEWNRAEKNWWRLRWIHLDNNWIVQSQVLKTWKWFQNLRLSVSVWSLNPSKRKCVVGTHGLWSRERTLKSSWFGKYDHKWAVHNHGHWTEPQVHSLPHPPTDLAPLNCPNEKVGFQEQHSSLVLAPEQGSEGHCCDFNICSNEKKNILKALADVLMFSETSARRINKFFLVVVLCCCVLVVCQATKALLLPVMLVCVHRKWRFLFKGPERKIWPAFPLFSWSKP